MAGCPLAEAVKCQLPGQKQRHDKKKWDECGSFYGRMCRARPGGICWIFSRCMPDGSTFWGSVPPSRTHKCKPRSNKCLV